MSLDEKQVKKMDKEVFGENPYDFLEEQIEFAQASVKALEKEEGALRAQYRLAKFMREDDQIKKAHEALMKSRKRVNFLKEECSKMENMLHATSKPNGAGAEVQ